MTPRRLVSAFAAGGAHLVVAVAAVTLLGTTGCSSDRPGPGPEPVAANEVIGTLVAVKDDRPADGGIDLTLETASGTRELVRVPSIFMPPPRDSVQAMHDVVDASKVGDRLRARGARDETGALRAEILEPMPR